jgi:ppGpp synthetase/RelA/SpoT-type nucleotidyltranferase
VDRFLEKAMKSDESGSPKYDDPIHQIQDMIGVRIVTYYLSDVDAITEKVCEYFKKIEEKQLVPDSADKFGYEGKHFILFIPRDVVDSSWCGNDDPKFFELQIKTLFQHAWGESSHDLAYKPDNELTVEQKRLVAYAAAQAWGGDMIFNRLAKEIGRIRL